MNVSKKNHFNSPLEKFEKLMLSLRWLKHAHGSPDGFKVHIQNKRNSRVYRAPLPMIENMLLYVTLKVLFCLELIQSSTEWHSTLSYTCNCSRYGHSEAIVLAFTALLRSRNNYVEINWRNEWPHKTSDLSTQKISENRNVRGIYNLSIISSHNANIMN